MALLQFVVVVEWLWSSLATKNNKRRHSSSTNKLARTSHTNTTSRDTNLNINNINRDANLNNRDTTNLNINRDANLNTNNTNRDTNLNTNRDTNRDTNLNTNRDTNRDTNLNTNNTNRDTNLNTNNTNRDANLNTNNTNRDTNLNTNRDTNRDTNLNTNNNTNRDTNLTMNLNTNRATNLIRTTNPFNSLSRHKRAIMVSVFRGMFGRPVRVDFRSKMWVCCFCFQRNPFPKSYEAISEQSVPAELLITRSTIEYTLLNKQNFPPFFLFVVDICIDNVELKALKESINMSLSFIPSTSLIGFITFGYNVHVHMLDMRENRKFKKQFVFPGTKVQTAYTIQKQLEGIHIANVSFQQPGPAVPPSRTYNQYLQPLQECAYSLDEIIADMRHDNRKDIVGRRALRATGAALSIAIGLLEASNLNTCGRIMTFLGGPCTHGPGVVVDSYYANPIRSHHDITKGKCQYTK
ncbi:hypothetical protein Pcinc_039323 [Petrolisthes cinctipes]|uniref:Protein transport protein SEC23 n=1 Tax=Petrolisthes cinctipes TaxID=88211 RepID=A0AAE1BRU4_PETCI|nr:hypothetical protein Pcinc_039323 [Petrolisthes cinctipes]